MSIRGIDNLTFYAELDEYIELPKEVSVKRDGVHTGYEPVTWYPKTVNTDKPADLVFIGKVEGYPDDILCSVIIDGIEENPPSVFPGDIDEFGNRKVDIQTADIPDIDDFQYFKAKYPRSTVEGYQLMRLREKLADKVIMARDVNHMRNAIIEIEKFLKDIEARVEDLEERMTELEARVTQLEKETVIDGKNLGEGEGVFTEKIDRILNFKSIIGGEGVNVSSDGEEITLVSPPTTGCGKNVKAQSYSICDTNGEFKFPMEITDGEMKITQSGSFGFKMVDLKPDGQTGTIYPSLLISLGEGQLPDRRGAGRILKFLDGYLFETKAREGEYVGLEISTNMTNWYTGASRVKENLLNPSEAGVY